jgi:hypothetical protein
MNFNNIQIINNNYKKSHKKSIATKQQTNIILNVLFDNITVC